VCVYEGKIVTCDSANSVRRFLVEERGRIAFVGDGLPEQYRSAPRTGLGPRSMLPAFGDAHLHFSSFALFSSTLDLRSARSVVDILDMTRAAYKGKGKTVLGFGASAHCLAEGRLPERSDLDAGIPGAPIYLIKYDGHAAIASSALLARLPERIRVLRGYDGEKGHLFQEAYFAAADYVTAAIPPLSLVDAMLRAADTCASKGIALLHAAEGVGFPRDLDVDLVRIVGRGLRQSQAVRVFFQTMDEGKAQARGLSRVGGCFATALDGSFGSVDAALLAPYANDPSNKGILFHREGEIEDFVDRSSRAGLQVALHAIGDAAFDRAVRAFDRALTAFPRDDHRHTIIHACLPTERGLERAAALGLRISAQPAFSDWPLEPASYLESILGERAARLNPLNSMRKLGIELAGGSDAPCTLPDPIAGIHAACNHPDGTESLCVMDAIRIFTMGPAKLSFDEAERGSLEAGKRADFVILDRDILATPVRSIKETKVEGLYLGGELYQGGQGSASVLARGLLSGART
jgi:predicted amidohydrolase YtcJ